MNSRGVKNTKKESRNKWPLDNWKLLGFKPGPKSQNLEKSIKFKLFKLMFAIVFSISFFFLILGLIYLTNIIPFPYKTLVPLGFLLLTWLTKANRVVILKPFTPKVDK